MPTSNGKLKKPKHSTGPKAYSPNQAQLAGWIKLISVIVPRRSMETARSITRSMPAKLMEVPLMNTTHYIGIDMALENFTASIYQGPDKSVACKEAIINSGPGYNAFTQWLASQNANPQNSMICLEATGVYAEALVRHLLAQGFCVAVEPPLKVKRAFYPVGHKNDRIDSRQIAEYAFRFRDQLRLYHPRPDTVEKIKHLLTFRDQLTRQSVATQNAIKAYDHHIVKDQTVLTVQDDHLRHLKDQIAKLDRHIKELLNDDPSTRELFHILISICGVGVILSAHLLVASNLFQDIDHYKRMSAFAGICPYEHQSGKSVYREPRCRSFGSMPIKHILHLAACSASQYDPQIRKYYLRKIEEGKPKKLVINNIANKIIKVAFAMVRNKQPFIKNYRSVNPKFLVPA